jgi:hypothetical protein
MVTSSCFDIADAKAFQSRIFVCDKIGEEEDMMQPAPFSPHFKNHHHHGKKHGHGKAHRAIGPLVLIIVVAAHFYNMRTFVQAMEDKETLKGETHDADWGCHWSNKKAKKDNKAAHKDQESQQPVSYAPSSSPVVVMPATQMQ